MNYVKLYNLVCVNVFLFVKAQVTFNPDVEKDVQLKVAEPTPPIQVTTVQCYSSSPEFTVQYVTTDAKETGRVIYNGNNSRNVSDGKCGQSQRLYRVNIAGLKFIADSVLVGGTFRLKATLDNYEGNSTLSKTTYTFPAPFNLTGSSASAVLYFNFTWTCHVTSDYPIVQWHRDGTDLKQAGIRNEACETSGTNDPYVYNCQYSQSTYTLTIPGPNLREGLQNSTWRCRNVTDETKGSKYMKLDVLYPPTVSLYIQNTTENTRNHKITCKTEGGKPNNATTVALQQRIGSILIRNITSFTEFSSGNITLSIPRVSYQDMGTYTCLASNGIPDRNNQKIQSDTAYFDVIISARFEMMEYTIRSDIDTPANISIPFYRNPPAGESDVVWTKRTGASNETLKDSANLSLSLRDADVQQPFYGVDVTLKGQSANMMIPSFQNYYEGTYTLKIRSNHIDNAKVTIVLMRSGPPDTPSGFSRLTSKETSVILAWNKGSDGGHPQTFVILYKDDASEVYIYTEIQDTTTNLNVSYEIKGLKSDTSYEFILYSFNEKGNSTGHQTLEERTLEAPVESTPSSLNIAVVGGAGGGGGAVLVVIIVLIGVVRKRRRTKEQVTESNSKTLSAEPKRQNDDNEGGDGLKDNPVYGASQSGANTVQGAIAAQEYPSSYAEVVKPKKKSPVQQGEDPPHIYAEVDKPQKTNGKGKQKKQKAKVKAEGDKYQNVDGLKQNWSTDNQKVKENEQRGYRNKDGLFYMDVKFDQPPTRGKPTIRKEEQTGYAMIQFEESNAKPTSNNVRGAEGGR